MSDEHKRNEREPAVHVNVGCFGCLSVVFWVALAILLCKHWSTLNAAIERWLAP